MSSARAPSLALCLSLLAASASAQDTIGCFVPGECAGSIFLDETLQMTKEECLVACQVKEKAKGFSL